MKGRKIHMWWAIGLVMGGMALNGCDKKLSTAKSAEPPGTTTQKSGLPRLLELGAEGCPLCELMKPVLAKIKKEYRGKMQVDFIDAWKNPEEAGVYGNEFIPTQIFFDPAGRELFRHTGYYSEADILGKWKEFGVTF